MRLDFLGYAYYLLFRINIICSKELLHTFKKIIDLR